MSGTDLLVFLAAIIRENFEKPPWIQNGEDFAIHSST